MTNDTSPPTPESDVEITPSENTITFKRSHLYTVLLPLAFVLGLSVGYLFWGRGTESAVAVAQSPNTQGEIGALDVPAQVTRYDVPDDNDPSIGPEDAPITIIEFSDYECPYCRRWHTEVFPRLLDAYPDEIRIVYRDFPISSIHQNAIPAAEAANCAFEQGSFWEFNIMLFSMELGLSTEAYQEYASELGLDMDAFDECLESRRYQDEVQEDFEFASTLGVRSTPTFFINGIAVIGAQPYEVFQQVINQELAGELD